MAGRMRVVLEGLVLAVELAPDDLGNGGPVSPLLVNVAAVVLLSVFPEDVGKVELQGLGDVLLELSLDDLVVPDELTDGNAVLLDEVKIGGEAAALWDRRDETAVPFSSLVIVVSLWLFVFYVEDID